MLKYYQQETRQPTNIPVCTFIIQIFISFQVATNWHFYFSAHPPRSVWKLQCIFNKLASSHKCWMQWIGCCSRFASGHKPQYVIAIKSVFFLQRENIFCKTMYNEERLNPGRWERGWKKPISCHLCCMFDCQFISVKWFSITWKLTGFYCTTAGIQQSYCIHGITSAPSHLHHIHLITYTWSHLLHHINLSYLPHHIYLIAST